VLDDLIDHIGKDAVREVVGLFRGECRELTEVIGRAADDPAAARRAAHSLKSSAGQVGAAALAQAAKAVEAADATAMRDLAATLAECAVATETVLVRLLE
jgi:HPt (histidine-containing phosphotransfer) domain-containing protein